MKKYLSGVLWLLFLLPLSVSGQEKGINFRDIGFKQALKEAKEEGKLLLIDCYTSWCGPCRYMAKNIFVLEEVGKYINDKFVCVKYDLEKGEGPELAKRYRVFVYPTFLVINPDGTLRHKWVGAMGGNEFIAKAGEAFDEQKAIGVMEVAYNQGKRDKQLLTKYAKALDFCEDPTLPAVIEELMKVLTDEEKFAPEYRYIYEVVNKSPVGSLARKFFEANRGKFEEIMGVNEVERNIYIAYSHEFWEIFKGKRTVTLSDVEELRRGIEAAGLQQDAMLGAYYRIAKAMAHGDLNKIIKTCEKEFPELPKGHIPKKLFELYASKATSAQKTRWEELIESISQE